MKKIHRILRMGNDISVLQFNLFNKSNPASLYSQMSRNQAQNQLVNLNGLRKTKCTCFY